MIAIEQVSKSFGRLRAVDNLSLHIGQGEFVALLGPNGAGKTTLVEMVEGLQQPDTGHIAIGGLSWQKHATELRAKLGISLQETRFIDKLTVRETLHLFASFYRLPLSRAAETMALVNLEAKANTFTVNLSGGQRQRLALGVAVMNRPEVLVLDEPTTGLDPNARRDLWKILLDLKNSTGTTLVLTTHYMEEAERLCERIVIMDKGRILADGTLAQLLNRFSKGEVLNVELAARPAFWHSDEALRQALPGLLEWKSTAPQLVNGAFAAEILVEDMAKALPPFIEKLREAQVELLQIASRKKTLDDLFVAMTGRRLDE